MSGFALLIFFTLIYLSCSSQAQELRNGTARERYLEECRRKRRQQGKRDQR